MQFFLRLSRLLSDMRNDLFYKRFIIFTYSFGKFTIEKRDNCPRIESNIYEYDISSTKKSTFVEVRKSLKMGCPHLEHIYHESITAGVFKTSFVKIPKYSSQS